MPLLTAYERTQQVQGRALAFFDNNAALSDPLGYTIKKASNSFNTSIATVAGKTVNNLGVSVQAALAVTNPSQYGIVFNPRLYPVVSAAPAAPAVVPSVILPISVDADAFIVKYSVTGVVQWATRISGTSGDEGYDITTDATGVYVTGGYNSTSVVTLNNGVTLPISVGNDAFIVKYDTSGLAQWATTIPGTATDRGLGIATDSTGVYVTGQYTSTSVVTLNNGKTLPISVGQDAFIVKYNTSGLAQWATRISGTSSDVGDGIATDSTGVYVTGGYNSTSVVTLNNGVTLPISVGADVFIVKYDTSGVAQWATRISGTSFDIGNGITTDSTGVYVTGYYSSTSVVTLNNGVTLPISVGFDAFIVKYDTSGLAQWATTIPGTGNDAVYSIRTDSTGVYVSGYYTSTSVVTLNNGVTLPISVSSDAFIVKYDTNGLAQWATTIQGPGSDFGIGITTDATGVYVIGYYSSASVVTLNNGVTLPISVSYDAFIVKYNTSGVAQWATTIPGTGFDFGYGITTDSTGVYVSGQYSSTSAITLANGS